MTISEDSDEMQLEPSEMPFDTLLWPRYQCRWLMIDSDEYKQLIKHKQTLRHGAAPPPPLPSTAPPPPQGKPKEDERQTPDADAAVDDNADSDHARTDGESTRSSDYRELGKQRRGFMSVLRVLRMRKRHRRLERLHLRLQAEAANQAQDQDPATSSSSKK